VRVTSERAAQRLMKPMHTGFPRHTHRFQFSEPQLTCTSWRSSLVSRQSPWHSGQTEHRVSPAEKPSACGSFPIISSR